MDGAVSPESPGRKPASASTGTGPGRVMRLLIAEDMAVIREALSALLGLEDDIEVAAAVARGDQILPAALIHRPDVALLDIALPGTDGITAAAELASRLPGCKVLILTELAAPGNLEAALQAGVSGFLLKAGPADELIAAVRAVAGGEHVIDTRLAGPALSASLAIRVPGRCGG